MQSSRMLSQRTEWKLAISVVAAGYRVALEEHGVRLQISQML